MQYMCMVNLEAWIQVHKSCTDRSEWLAAVQIEEKTKKKNFSQGVSIKTIISRTCVQNLVSC